MTYLLVRTADILVQLHVSGKTVIQTVNMASYPTPPTVTLHTASLSMQRVVGWQQQHRA